MYSFLNWWNITNNIAINIQVQVFIIIYIHHSQLSFNNPLNIFSSTLTCVIFLIPAILVGQRQYLTVELIFTFYTIRLLYNFRELQTSI